MEQQSAVAFGYTQVVVKEKGGQGGQVEGESVGVVNHSGDSFQPPRSSSPHLPRQSAQRHQDVSPRPRPHLPSPKPRIPFRPASGRLMHNNIKARPYVATGGQGMNNHVAAATSNLYEPVYSRGEVNNIFPPCLGVE